MGTENVRGSLALTLAPCAIPFAGIRSACARYGVIPAQPPSQEEMQNTSSLAHCSQAAVGHRGTCPRLALTSPPGDHRGAPAFPGVTVLMFSSLLQQVLWLQQPLAFLVTLFPAQEPAVLWRQEPSLAVSPSTLIQKHWSFRTQSQKAWSWLLQEDGVPGLPCLLLGLLSLELHGPWPGSPALPPTSQPELLEAPRSTLPALQPQ